MANDEGMKLILAYSYKRGHLEGQADLARVLREKIRNNTTSNPYSLLIELENNLLSIMEESNTRIAQLRNSSSYE